MNESEPHLIDLKALFAAIDGTISAGGNVGDLFEDPNLSSERSIQERIEEGRIKLLDVILIRGRMPNELVELDVRQTAIDFRNEIESWRRGILANHRVQAERKKIAESTTIEDLVRTAEAEHEKWARLSGREVPNTVEHLALQNEAYRWEIVSKIVRAASEIRD